MAIKKKKHSISASMSMSMIVNDYTYPLSDDVAHGPRDDDVVVLVLIEVKVFLHAGDEGIGDIGCVDL